MVGRREVADHTTPSHLFDGLVVGKQLLAVVFLVLGGLPTVDCPKTHEITGVTAVTTIALFL